ncbi:hypothetical protein LTR95_000636 [Oleoguttula sp. CCFEE 5521]
MSAAAVMLTHNLQLPNELHKYIIEILKGQLDDDDFYGVMHVSPDFSAMLQHALATFAFEDYSDKLTIRGSRLQKTQSLAYATRASRVKLEISLDVSVDPCWESDEGMYRTAAELSWDSGELGLICAQIGRLRQARDLLIATTLLPRTNEYGYATIDRKQARDQIACAVMKTLHRLPCLQKYCVRVGYMESLKFFGNKLAQGECITTKTDRS